MEYDDERQDLRRNRMMELFKKEWSNGQRKDRVSETVETIKRFLDPKEFRKILEAYNRRFGLMKEIQEFLFSERRYQAYENR